ncbi:hypothetical protein E2C01_101907 [Portunus trituberculatus]|uniref:Uncharacterized protein n=1 Tax=Portunus trituberculatus TaxID=210409 RepID=A0A5B7KLC2_PORTR|nr:hypothetical protein [Portunus trituberculatus]
MLVDAQARPITEEGQIIPGWVTSHHLKCSFILAGNVQSRLHPVCRSGDEPLRNFHNSLCMSTGPRVVRFKKGQEVDEGNFRPPSFIPIPIYAIVVVLTAVVIVSVIVIVAVFIVSIVRSCFEI